MLGTLLALWICGSAIAADPTLPSPVRIAPATWPPEALQARQEASVLLEVAIDAEGNVTDARVAEPTGSGFDDAARLALLASRFTPARDEAGVAVPSVIQFRYRFTLEAVAAPSIRGRVEAATGPIAGARVRASGPDGGLAVGQTDENGEFVLSGLADGAWQLAVEADGLLPEVAAVDVRSGQLAEVKVALVAPVADAPASDVIVVQADRPVTDVTVRTLTSDEIAVLPGTSGDVVRAVQNLPGIARPPLDIGQLIIRGTAPEDSIAFLDGARVPIVFHFAGLSTVVSSDVIDEVAYLPGNPSVRYGRFLGGLIDIKTIPALPEPKGDVSVDVYQTSAYGAFRIGEHDGFQVSARRSYIDAVLTPILSKGSSTVRAPRYYDGQARWVHEDAVGVTEVFAYGSSDAFRVLDGAGNTQIGLQTRFARVRGRHFRELGGGWSSETVLAAGPDQQAFQFDADGDAFEKSAGMSLRQEFSLPASETVIGKRLGLDLEAGRDAYRYAVPAFGPTEEGATLRIAPAAYAEATIQAGRATVSPGVRGDAIWLGTGYTGLTLDPRLSGRFELNDTLDVRAAVGQYSRFPSFRQVEPTADGNPELTAATSWQTSIGIDADPLPELHIEATGFYDRLRGLVSGREDRLRFFTGPPPIGPLDTDPYANDGRGRIYGGELLVRWVDDRTIGLLSLTVSRSERIERPGQDWTVFEYDQPIILNAIGSRDLGRGFRIGARARFGSGNPFTPVVNRFYDLNSREFVPLYGAAGSDRLPPFFALDVRFDKEWKFERWSLGTYIDVRNATNRKNPEVMGWSYDYSDEEPITGLPTTPTFGVEAKW